MQPDHASQDKTVYHFDVNVVTPIVVCLILVLMVLFVLRAKLEKTAWFQGVMSTLNMRSLGTYQPRRTAQGTKQGPQFDLPPEYAVALHMPMPSVDSSEEDVTPRCNEQSSENNGHLSEVSEITGTSEIVNSNLDITSSCQVNMDNQDNEEDNVIITDLGTNNLPDCVFIINDNGINAGSSPMCSPKDNIEKTLPTFMAGHLHKMVFNPASPLHYLPTYDEYTQQLPSVHHM